MKKITQMFLLLMVFLLNNAQLYAQLSDSLDINNINARFWADGVMFWDKVGYPKFEYPKGSGKHLNFAAGMWMGGLDGAGQLRVAAQTYQQTGMDYWAGPSVGSIGSYADSLYNARYNRTWKISKTVIDNHIANYAQTGYVVPQEIVDWPGSGNIANGESEYLAPYFDANNDQIYTPQLGDYPLIPGDQAVFFMFNDSRDIHTETQGPSIGVEVKALAYSFNAPLDSILNSSIFISYAITNKSNITYTNFYVGLWDDFDLGYYQDDAVGSDSTLQAIYSYNKDIEDNLPYGYGVNPPATGFTFLNRTLSHAIHNYNDYSLVGNPETTQHYYNYLRNIWKDGTLMVNNGANGLSATAAGTTTNYMYSGYPELNQGWVDNSTSGDKRCVGSTIIDVFYPQKTECFDVSFVAARGNSNLNSVAVLRQSIQHIRDFYQNNLLACATNANVGLNKVFEDLSMNIYPNPTFSNKIQLSSSSADFYDIRIWNTNAQLMYQNENQLIGNHPTEIQLSDLAKGVYFIQCKNNRGDTFSQKIVLQ